MLISPVIYSLLGNTVFSLKIFIPVCRKNSLPFGDWATLTLRDRQGKKFLNWQ
jgi:hypothetical protein